MAACAPAIILRATSFSSVRTSFNTSHSPIKPSSPKISFTCRAQKQADDQVLTAAMVTRRLALSVLVGAAAVATKVSPADAAYGEAANVFGAPKKNTDFISYSEKIGAEHLHHARGPMATCPYCNCMSSEYPNVRIDSPNTDWYGVSVETATVYIVFEDGDNLTQDIT